MLSEVIIRPTMVTVAPASTCMVMLALLRAPPISRATVLNPRTLRSGQLLAVLLVQSLSAAASALYAGLTGKNGAVQRSHQRMMLASATTT